MDNNSPIYIWCHTANQADITLNILQTTRTDPILLEYAQWFRDFFLNVTPMSPMGTKVITHEKLNQYATWRKHRVAGWYLGPALEHYWFYRVFVTNTRYERIANVVNFFHKV